MAEGVLFNIAEGIIGRLGSFAFQEIELLWGVKDELNKLQEAVAQIQAVLLDAEQKQANHEVKRWLKNLEDVVYDADDLLDEIYTETQQRQTLPGNNKFSNQVCIFFSNSNQLTFQLKIGHKIKKINERLDAITTLRNKFHFEERFKEKTFIIGGRETHSFVPVENIIGRDEDKRKIIQLLMDPISKENENVLIISVVGFGGLGKTALVQLVFNDQVVQKHFELKMWICVSNEFELHILVKKIIESATNGKAENLQIDQLQSKLRKIIDGKRYLLVLDDVWNEDPEKWNSLKDLLMGGAKGSRIIITTRSEKVARISNTNESYPLRGLDETLSWNLFKQMAFGDKREPNNSTIKTSAEKIAKRCGGIPLVIRTIGRLLHSKDQETEWLAFENTEFSKLKLEEDKIIPTLKLSYDVLPSHLKHCFAYCSLFPPDYEFDVKSLIQLWVAQGFVKPSKQCMDDDGYEYFKELLWRSFFQEEIKDEFGMITKCKMHDMMNQLAIAVSGTESRIIDQKFEKVNFDHEKLRHVSFDFDVDLVEGKMPSSLLKANKIRTFLLLRQDIDCYAFFILIESGLIKSFCNVVASNFKLLRMLSLKRLKIKILPNSFEKLKHLRYLDLSDNPIERLPNWLVKLRNLETLDLTSCGDLRELPRDIEKLINLRHLLLDGCYRLTHLPRGLGTLTGLRTLTVFVLSEDKSLSSYSAGLGELKRLNELRGHLRIENLRQDAKSESSAVNIEKQYLHSLSLHWKPITINMDDENDEVISIKQLEALQPHSNLKELFLNYYEGVRFANWLNSLTNIVNLSLSHCYRCQYLPAELDELPYLKVLELSYLEQLEYITDKERSTTSVEFSASSLSTSPTPFFPSLKKLDLWHCPNLKGWWRLPQQQQHLPSLPSFPCLSELSVCDCPYLTSMPLYPYLDQRLRLADTSLKPFQETTMMVERKRDDDDTSSCSSLLNILVSSFVCGGASSSSFSSLNNLKSLHIGRIDDVDMPQGIGNLKSLERLSISHLPNLASLPEEIGNLTSLQSLQILSCPNLASLPEEIGNLSSFQRLVIFNCPQLTSLPEGMRHLKSLVELQIEHCPNLASLPEGIGNLSSLQGLIIIDCPQLASLPEGMRHLTSLQRLRIHNCSILLHKRCKEETGEDWPKISHIPDINISHFQMQESETLPA